MTRARPLTRPNPHLRCSSGRAPSPALPSAKTPVVHGSCPMIHTGLALIEFLLGACEVVGLVILTAVCVLWAVGQLDRNVEQPRPTTDSEPPAVHHRTPAARAGPPPVLTTAASQSQMAAQEIRRPSRTSPYPPRKTQLTDAPHGLVLARPRGPVHRRNDQNKRQPEQANSGRARRAWRNGQRPVLDTLGQPPSPTHRPSPGETPCGRSVYWQAWEVAA